MSIILSADSTIDLSPAELEKYHIPVVHFHLEKEGQSYLDNELTLEEMYAYTEKTHKMCHTSAPNIDQFQQHFAHLLEECDDIIHFSMSSKLSSSYSNACAAAEGNPHIHVIDTKVTSGGIALLALYANDLLQAGYPFEEIVSRVEARIPYDQTSFQLDKLKFLYLGGRCSSLSLFGANLLMLKPEIVCSPDGSFKVGKKHRGNIKKCDYEYFQDLFDSHPNIDKKRCALTCSTFDEKQLQEYYEFVKKQGFEEIIFNHASPTNAYHSGPNVVGLHFLFDGPHPVTPYEVK